MSSVTLRRVCACVDEGLSRDDWESESSQRAGGSDGNARAGLREQRQFSSFFPYASAHITVAHPAGDAEAKVTKGDPLEISGFERARCVGGEIALTIGICRHLGCNTVELAAPVGQH